MSYGTPSKEPNDHQWAAPDLKPQKNERLDERFYLFNESKSENVLSIPTRAVFVKHEKFRLFPWKRTMRHDGNVSLLLLLLEENAQFKTVKTTTAILLSVNLMRPLILLREKFHRSTEVFQQRNI